MKKKILALALALTMIAAAVVGGTFAYLSDVQSDVNVMTMGNVYIKQHEYQRVVDADGNYVTDTIDNRTSYVLEDFEQGKPILPIVGDPSESGVGSAGYDTIPVRMSQVNSYGGMDVFAGKNAVDKFVVVENTGRSDAYIRTIVAIEIGDGNASLIGSSYHNAWEKTAIGAAEIDGNTYYIFEYLYKGAQLSDGSWRHEGGKLTAGDTAYPSLSQIYIRSKATNEDCEALDGNGNGTLDILVVTQAVQTAGFDNAEDALNTAFGKVSEKLPWDESYTAVKNVTVSTDEELLEALSGYDVTTFAAAPKAAPELIRVTLAADVTYDVGAWSDYNMGGNATKTVIIDGAGEYTLTFNQTNSDWNHIDMVNDDGTLILTNLDVTNAGHNDGPWNRHDLNFACNVQLINVNSDKAMAFKAGASLKNVTIDDRNTSESGTYAIWIQPNGQTVTLDNVTIDMENCVSGRGIKIDEQYVNAEDVKKVTLLVSNTTFKTIKKSAILVKSSKGADVVLNNVDISGCKEDNIFPVWVDEDADIYADLVNVTGGTKIVEGNTTVTVVTEPEEVKDAIDNAQKGDIISLPDNAEISLPTLADKEGVTIIGTGDTVIGGDDVTTGFGSNFGKDTTIKGVNFVGAENGVRWSYATGGNTVFEDCTFAGDSIYGFHIDESKGANFTFNDCTFSGFNAFAGDLASVTFNNCTFLNNGNYGHTNIWSTAYFNDCVWGDGTSFSGGGSNYHIYVNNVEESYHHEFIGSAESLVAFANTVNVADKDGNYDNWQGQKIVLVNDIDLAGIDWEPIGQTGRATFAGMFDGNGYTIYNLTIDSEAETGDNYSSALFGWLEGHGDFQKEIVIENVTVKGATVNGHHNVAVIAGYATGVVRIENCHVYDADITCTKATDEADGDKAGVIVGNSTVEISSLKNCSATDCTVSAGRDAGQITGAGNPAKVTDCTATNVTVTANGTSTGANITNDVIGRVLQ